MWSGIYGHSCLWVYEFHEVEDVIHNFPVHIYLEHYLGMYLQSTEVGRYFLVTTIDNLNTYCLFTSYYLTAKIISLHCL